MSIKPKWICFLVGHKWDMYCGWYEERVHPKAKCERCENKYEDTSNRGRSRQTVDDL